MKTNSKLFFAAITAAGAGLAWLYKKNEIKKNDHIIKRAEKFRNYYYMLNQWMINKNQNKSIGDFLEKNNYYEIAIYGMGEMGQRLIDELKGSNIKIKYIIDQNADYLSNEIPVIKKEDSFERVDAIIVTATFAYKEISKDLSARISCPILSLEDVINGIF